MVQSFDPVPLSEIAAKAMGFASLNLSPAADFRFVNADRLQEPDFS
jgi:hypothetical protein